MPNFSILYDEPHEADWFRALHPALADASETPITQARGWPSLQQVLAYDRPDVILMDGNVPILVVEETVEVPSGHNVGQRFARIAAAAEAGVPSFYFGPYVARKHGGETEGPRYMNARLFYALEAMERTTGSAVSTINWGVDDDCEVRRDPAKDNDVREYMATFLDLYARNPNLQALNRALIFSEFHQRMVRERNDFVSTRIRNPQQYDGPPKSLEIVPLAEFQRARGIRVGFPRSVTELVVYNVGMKNIRSDPYTGMSMLYKYLYVAENVHRALVLWFPEITIGTWRATAINATRKDIRIFRHTADAVLFYDGFLLASEL